MLLHIEQSLFPNVVKQTVRAYLSVSFVIVYWLIMK